jgi:transmembrane sensor
MFRDLGALGAQLDRRNVRPFPGQPAKAARHMVGRRALLGGAIAASAAGYMLLNPPLAMWPSLEELSADYRTAKGEQRDISIADNVAIKLSTQTSISIRGDGSASRIELINGEAAVNARRASSEPVMLIAGNGRISSATAEFNIRCIDGVVLATCLNGSVTVTQRDRSVQLGRGEQVSYSATDLLGLPLPVADPGQAVSWRDNLLIFRDKPLVAVVSEVNRYRPGKIVVMNSELGQRLVNGTFQTDKLDDFVAQVRQLFGADVRSLPGGIVLLS